MSYYKGDLNGFVILQEMAGAKRIATDKHGLPLVFTTRAEATLYKNAHEKEIRGNLSVCQILNLLCQLLEQLH